MTIDIGIQRSHNNRWIRGVCAGIAHSIGINPIWIRLAFIFGAIVIPGVSLLTMIIVYVVLGIILPESDTF
ncbi:MAG TPA: PspC domain-containing protein [Thermomicrobiales bacterium]|nr:PspC domain-containing protein [Thermomicrobiales bacterium]